MSTSVVTLSRQSGLMTEMRTIANNMANMSTTGFRREGVLFSEFVSKATPLADSMSMTAARARHIDLTQGALSETGGQLDLAIEGEGFFMIEGPDGERLTRAGGFATDANGDLVTPDGLRVLDAGGAPIFIPPDARSISVSSDGTLSADGRPLNQIGLVRPVDPNGLKRLDSASFRAEGGVEPVETSVILQGYVESANVEPVREIARMIEVQRAYELGQAFIDRESDRRSKVIDTLTR